MLSKFKRYFNVCLCLFAVLAIALPSWGAIAKYQADVYQYDVDLAVLGTQNYDYGVIQKLSGGKVGQAIASLSDNVQGQSSLAFVDGFFVTKKGTFPDEIFSKKAPKQTTPGTKTLEGQYINDQGRVEPWKAHYDEYGRQIGRTDYNAGNKAQDIPGTHHHTYEYGPGKNGMETGSHLPGEYKP